MIEVSVFAAAVAGVVSFLSPCVLPLVPGYLSYVSGMSHAELQGGTLQGGTAVTIQRAGGQAVLLRSVTANAAAFVLGFTTIFVLLGASATAVGQFLVATSGAFTKVAGVVIVLFGLHILGVLRVPVLYREKRIRTEARPRTLLGSYGVGMAFAFGWTPCIGPILAGVLTLAATQETVLQGMGLLTVYSLGLGIPFLVAALGANYLLAFTIRFRRYFRVVEVASGVLLIAVGVLVFTNHMTWLSGKLGFLNRFVL
jgi:cytochrome c-type biogenesis protein